ncbi:MAG: tripartite tricarboxylate transporter substrate binding protein [Polaromonas sp.]|nr:tripartite tricarboxylate transporter substrate binding protein [Polaromonas sp.]
MTFFNRGILPALLPALWLTAALPPAQAQPAGYPNKPVRLVVAFAAGGIADSVARLVGVKLAEKLGQPVVVENRGGAGGNIGARVVAAAEPDGYTFLVTTAAFAVNTSLYKNPGYNVSDFAPVALTASTPNLFAMATANPSSTLQDIAKNYKGKPLSYSTAGIGSSSHLTAQYIFKNLMGLDAVHVPYQGGAPAVNAAVAGHVDVVSTSMPTAMGNVAGGRLKGIALASLKRVDALPNTQTIGESGVGDYEDRSWVGFFAPARINPETVRRLNSDINDIIRQPEMRDKLAAVGFEPASGSPRDFADYLRKENAKWALIVKATNITLNE